MFPNLRLITGATIATLALVIIMGSGLFSFRDPQNGVADIPDLRRPLVQRAIVANPDQLQALAYSRRSDELQRLLELPTSPVRTPPVTESYPFDSKAPGTPQVQAPELQTPGPPLAARPADPAQAAEPEPQAASEAAATPADAQAEAAPPAVTAIETPPAEAAPPVPAPDMAVASLPPAEPEQGPQPAEPSDRSNAVPPDAAPAAQAAAPAPVPPDTAPAPAAIAALAPASEEPAASAAASAPAEDTVRESPIPAIKQAPLPRVDPRLSAARDGATASISRLGQAHAPHAVQKKVIRAARVLPRRVRRTPAAAVDPAGSTEQPQSTPFHNSNFDDPTRSAQ